MGQVSPLRVLKHTRPLCFHEGILYCSQYHRIVRTSDLGQTLEPVTDLALDGFHRRTARYFPLAQRILRLFAYRMRVLENGNIVVLFKGGIYLYQASNQGRAVRRFPVTKGSRPVSLAARPGGLVVFGEYWNNEERDEVLIYGSSDFGLNWIPVFRFGPGEIRHVHGISYDRWEDCFWIVTGDYGDECRLIRAAGDFSTVETVFKGGQLNRFYSIYVGRSFLATATDTPLEQNYLIMVDKRTGESRKSQAVQNSCFYHCAVGGRLFWSTNAEPSQVNDDQVSHVWCGDPARDRWTLVLSFATDGYDRLSHLPFVPKGLFQYPRLFFPEGHNPTNSLVCHAIGVADYDDSMLIYDTSQLEI